SQESFKIFFNDIIFLFTPSRNRRQAGFLQAFLLRLKLECGRIRHAGGNRQQSFCDKARNIVANGGKSGAKRPSRRSAASARNKRDRTLPRQHARRSRRTRRTTRTRARSEYTVPLVHSFGGVACEARLIRGQTSFAASSIERRASSGSVQS